MEFSAETSLFFDEFAEDITVDGVLVRGILDLTPADAFGVVGGLKPTLRLPGSVVIARNSTVVARGRNYTVPERPLDESGVWLVELTQA